MPLSLARSLFEAYTQSDAASLLQSLPSTTPKTFETTWLEFKSGYVRDNDFERIWSEVIGAFANTGGGVVVWGIGAAYDSDMKIDAAQNIQLVEDVNAFTTRLRRTAQHQVDPPLPGVEIAPVQAAPDSSKGFVVCYIPEGENKPYESLKAAKQFYMRFDDRCEKVSLPTLRLLFQPGACTQAELTVTHRLIAPNVQVPELIEFALTLTNTGYISIEAPSLDIRSQQRQPLTHVPNRGYQDLNRPSELTPTLLHPSMSSTFSFFVPRGTTGTVGREKLEARLYQKNHHARFAEFSYNFAHKEFYNPLDENELLPDKLSLVMVEMPFNRQPRHRG